MYIYNNNYIIPNNCPETNDILRVRSSVNKCRLICMSIYNRRRFIWTKPLFAITLSPDFGQYAAMRGVLVYEKKQYVLWLMPIVFAQISVILCICRRPFFNTRVFAY